MHHAFKMLGGNMSDVIVVKVDKETKNQIHLLAKENPYADGNLSIYIRGLLKKAWLEREEQAKSASALNSTINS